MRYSVDSPPSHGRLIPRAARGSFRYTPNRAFVGSDGFTFHAGDSAGTSAVEKAILRVPLSNPTMGWVFDPGPTFTTVSYLVASDVPSGVSVTALCRGGGCPFKVRTAAPRTRDRSGNIDLTRWFTGHKFKTHTRLTVSIVKPGAIGKAFVFIMRSSREPKRMVSCLAPSQLQPGAPC